MGSSENKPILNGVQYYWIYTKDLAILQGYGGGNGLADDFIYYVPGDNTKVYAICTSLEKDELDFLRDEEICNFEWFRYSNQPSTLVP